MSEKHSSLSGSQENCPEINRLLEIMARLRDPADGCPWDLEQDFSTIAPYTIEEAYEVADAIQRGHMDDLKDELGDLLLQVVFHSQMAAEADLFCWDDVVRAVCDKMIRRHPHVFGAEDIRDAEAQTRAWEEQKARERARKAESDGETDSVLAGLPLALPALLRALKLSNRAARAGFDWEDHHGVIDKLHEELDEIKAELPAKADMINEGQKDRIEEEIGDLLFVVANLARKFDINPETALRRGNFKFEQRFSWMEKDLAARARKVQDADMVELDRLWNAAKKAEKKS